MLHLQLCFHPNNRMLVYMIYYILHRSLVLLLLLYLLLYCVVYLHLLGHVSIQLLSNLILLLALLGLLLYMHYLYYSIVLLFYLLSCCFLNRNVLFLYILNRSLYSMQLLVLLHNHMFLLLHFHLFSIHFHSIQRYLLNHLLPLMLLVLL